MHLKRVDQDINSSIKTSAILKAHIWEAHFALTLAGPGTCGCYGNGGLAFSSSIHFCCWTSASLWNSSPTSSSDRSAGRWD